MSTARSTVPASSSRPISTAPTRCWRRPSTTGAALPGERAARFRFHHVSTDEVFGSLGPDGRFSEDSRYEPNSPYSASKAASDHLVRAWHETYGLPTVMSNCSNNYGPYHFPEKLIPLVILKALHGEAMPVYGKGDNVRDWLYVEDHARALHAVLTQGRPGETYNIGGDGERTNLEVVTAICGLLDEMRPQSPHRPHAGLITFVTDRPGHDRRYAIDAAKIRRRAGLAAAPYLRDRVARHGRVVSRQSLVVGTDLVRALSRHQTRHRPPNAGNTLGGMNVQTLPRAGAPR